MFSVSCQITEVFHRLQQYMDKVGDDIWAAWAIATSSDGGDCLPPPEIIWTLFELLFQVSRQQWARQIVDEHLGGKQALEAKADVKDQPIPSIPEWEYTTHFQNPSCRESPLFLRNHTTDEMIFVDWQWPSNSISITDFYDYFELNEPLVSRKTRLNDFFPEGHGLRVALEYLVPYCRLGHEVSDFESDLNRFEFHPNIEKHMGLVEKFMTAWQDPNRQIALAILIGDWPFVKWMAESHGLSQLAPFINGKADMVHRAWLNIVCGAWDRGQDKSILYVLSSFCC